MNAVNNAIAKAQEAAAATIDAVPAVVQAEVAPVPAVYVPARAPSMADAMASAQMRPDEWLKVKEHGLLLGTSREAIETMTVEINMTEQDGFYMKESIKYGNPAVYMSTYDGVTCDKGGAWIAAVGKAQAADPRAKPYYSVDIKMRLTADVKTLKGKKHEFGDAGKMLGHSTSTTNFDEWREFYREVAAAGLVGRKVIAKLTAKPLENKAGNVWGVIVFTLVGPAEIAKAA
jgi:hypothetical protein